MHADEVEKGAVGDPPVEGTAHEEEEADPGELVSVWYAMKKQYETTLTALREAAGSLNSIGEELRTKHGIQVPRVDDGRTPDLYAGTETTSAAAPANEAGDRLVPDPGWAPPSQGPITIDAPETGVHFVEELRRDAAIGDNEKGFAEQIGQMMSRFSGFQG